MSIIVPNKNGTSLKQTNKKKSVQFTSQFNEHISSFILEKETQLHIFLDEVHYSDKGQLASSLTSFHIIYFNIVLHRSIYVI